MARSRTESLKIKAKLLQKAKRKSGKPFALKDAFMLMARAAGFCSWQEFKASVETHEFLRPPYASAFWNTWYKSYDEAAEHLARHGGYLLPYEKDYFICGEDYVRSLGVALDDPDLGKVGQNWARPGDPAAWQRLLAKIKKARAAVG